MKLTSVEIHPSKSTDIAVLSFRDPGNRNPYNIKAITGLDLDAIVPKHYGSQPASVSAQVNYYNLVQATRTIVMQIGLNPDYANNKSYSDLRDDLYRMIASSRKGYVQLQFLDGFEPICGIDGYIQKFETPLFTSSPDVQLTIYCPNGALQALDTTDLIVSELDPENFTITDDDSTAPHGFWASITCSDFVPSITISDPDDPLWTFNVSPISGFLPGDELIFYSIDEKQLYVNRSGVIPIQLADSLVPGSVWPIIFPGDNNFSCTHAESLTINYIRYIKRYWGI